MDLFEGQGVGIDYSLFCITHDVVMMGDYCACQTQIVWEHKYLLKGTFPERFPRVHEDILYLVP